MYREKGHKVNKSEYNMVKYFTLWMDTLLWIMGMEENSENSVW